MSTGPTFEEAEKELEALLQPEQLTPTANIRILFARAWLARLARETEKMEKLFGIIIDVAKPEDLSPLLLSIVGDNARKKASLTRLPLLRTPAQYLPEQRICRWRACWSWGNLLRER